MGLIPTRVLATLFSLSPLSTLVVAAPQLRLSQTAIGPVSIATGVNGSAPSVDAMNAGDGRLNLRVSSSATWLVPTLGAVRDCPFAGLGCIPVDIALRTSSLSRGTYTGAITVSDPGAVDAPQTITVTVQVGGGVPDRADLYVPPNGSSSYVRFLSSSFLETSATTQSGGDWLAIGTEGSGSFRFGMSYPYRITATHRPGMAEGTYSGQATVSGSSVPTENRSVPVTLRVTSQPIVQLSAESLQFRIAQGSATQTQFAGLSNRGQGTLNITGANVATTSGGSWLAAEKVAGADLIQVKANPSGVGPGSYQGTVTITSNAAQGNLTIPVQLDVIAAGPPVAYFEGVVNNATFEAADFLGQGAIVAVFGEQFTTGEARSAASLPLANELGGARVFVNDRPAPVYYVSYGQINFQIPYDADPGNAVIRVERDGQRGNEISARIARGAPRLLRLGIGDYGIIVNGADGSFPIPRTPGINSRPAKRGETLVIYAIGLGPTEPAVASGVAAPSSPLARGRGEYRVSFGFSGPFGSDAVEVAPLFTGLTPTFVGLYQINVTIPADSPLGAAVPIALLSEDGSSNRVTIAIE